MSKEKLVKATEEMVHAVSDMRKEMDKVQETSQEKKMEIDDFKKKYPNARYLEPALKIPTRAKKVDEMEKQRSFLTEYVVGIFESELIMGTFDFFLTGLPGDPFCKWSIPVNKAVGIPRFVAKHLEKSLGWKQMKPLGKDNPPQEFYEEEMMTPFSRFEYKKRGTFHPINSY